MYPGRVGIHVGSTLVPELFITKQPDPKLAGLPCLVHVRWAVNYGDAVSIRAIVPHLAAGCILPLMPRADQTIGGVGPAYRRRTSLPRSSSLTWCWSATTMRRHPVVAVHYPERLGALVLTSCDV